MTSRNSQDDKDLFRQAVGEVTPIKQDWIPPGRAAAVAENADMTSRNSQDDKDLFRQAVSGVAPVKQDKIQPPPRRGGALNQKPGAAAASAAAVAPGGEQDRATFQTAAVSPGEELRYRRPGVQDKVFQRLRRGQERMEDELDLHGIRVAAARDSLAAFLDRCLARGCRHVKIVHGKGLHSPQGQATIKSLVGGWLQQRQEVLAYCSARPGDGGNGALYVLLKKRTRARR